MNLIECLSKTNPENNRVNFPGTSRKCSKWSKTLKFSFKIYKSNWAARRWIKRFRLCIWNTKGELQSSKRRLVSGGQRAWRTIHRWRGFLWFRWITIGWGRRIAACLRTWRIFRRSWGTTSRSMIKWPSNYKERASNGRLKWSRLKVKRWSSHRRENTSRAK
jgi:hypothetical protein